MPVWFNRLRYRIFGNLGHWTQAEIDDQHRRAREQYKAFRELADEEPQDVETDK